MNNENRDVDGTEVVVIAKPDIGVYLEVIGKKNIGYELNELKLQCMYKYQPKAEMLVRILSGAFGWREIDRKRVKTKTLAGFEIDVLVIFIEKLGAIR